MIELHDVVAVARDLPDSGLTKGARGAVVAVLERPCLAFEVEFCDALGVTRCQTAIQPEDLILVARGTSAKAMRSLPQDQAALEEWFDFVAADPRTCLRFMLGLARSMLSTWRASPHVQREDDTLEQILGKTERALDGVAVSEHEWAQLEARASSLYDVANGVRLGSGSTLDAVVTAHLALVCTQLYDDGVPLRRARLAAMTATAQAIAQEASLDRGPFADTAREVARWLLR